MGCPGGCSGGSGTSGKGRTPYAPNKSNAVPWTQAGRKTSSGGGATNDRRASEFGMPKVRASFSSRKK